VNDRIYSRFCDCIGIHNVLIDEPMKRHTSFRIGGSAEYFLQPQNIAEVQELLQICEEEKIVYHIIGNGSNILVGDLGITGVVIQIYKNMSKLTVAGETITAQAGASLSQLANAAAQAGLTGLEFAAGIPGTVGGAVVMNAGAYGGEIKQVLKQAVVINTAGELITLDIAELQMGYRTSIIKEKGYIVLETTFILEQDEQELIQERMNELKLQRVSKQPLEYPSAGSTFKRPEGHFAGKLIMDAGLRGYQVGGAQVSEKHCGFVINCGDAKASEVVALMNDVRAKVKALFAVELEPEVQFLGDFENEE